MKLLHPKIASFVAVLCIMTASADPVPGLVCEQCRGTDHSRDFGNYAFNQTYGVDSVVFEDELIILNLEGGWVHVDLSFVFEENIISMLGDLIGLDLGIPTRQLQIDTTTDSIQFDSYRIDLDLVDTMGPLPVGEDVVPLPGLYSPGTGTGGGGDSSGGGSTGGGGVGAGGGTSGAGSGNGGGGGGGNACTSAGDGEWHCVPF